MKNAEQSTAKRVAVSEIICPKGTGVRLLVLVLQTGAMLLPTRICLVPSLQNVITA